MGVVLIKPEDASGILEISSVQEAREYFEKNFPAMTSFIRTKDLERFVESEVSPLPTFKHVGDTLCNGHRCAVFTLRLRACSVGSKFPALQGKTKIEKKRAPH